MGSLFRLPPARSAEYKSPLVFLFGLLFLVAGIVVVLRIPYLFHLKGRLDDGLEVPARILRVEFISSGGGRHGGGASISVEYEFSVDGRVIKGHRASLFSQSSGLYSRLRKAFESGQEVNCFVDREDPALSALEKDIRVMDLFAYLLGLPLSIVGGLFLVRSFGVSRRQVRRGRVAGGKWR